MNLRISVLLFVALWVYQACYPLGGRQSGLGLSRDFVEQNLHDAAEQIKVLSEAVPEDAIPTTYKDGQHVNWGTSWWCSGFFPGTVLYLYEYTNDPELLDVAESKLALLEKEKHNKGTHDLGFMLFCSFGNALRLTGDSAAYKEVLLTGAESLSTRYTPTTNVIRSWDGGKNWDGKPWTYPVIIDNMMNLEFLTQASKISGDEKFREIALSHADRTMHEHFRPDYSSYHVVDYDPATGDVLDKKTAQGAFDESAWSRGQAWALYGYVMMYRETGEERYLELANNIADFYLNHRNLPEDKVPYWDMDQDQLTPESVYYKLKDVRDVSTAAVVASALLELSTYVGPTVGDRYLRDAEMMLESLSKPSYKAAYGENGGYILKHSVGSIPHKTEVDVPLTYADYYYVEALIRYLRLLEGEPAVKM